MEIALCIGAYLVRGIWECKIKDGRCKETGLKYKETELMYKENGLKYKETELMYKESGLSTKKLDLEIKMWLNVNVSKMLLESAIIDVT